MPCYLLKGDHSKGVLIFFVIHHVGTFDPLLANFLHYLSILLIHSSGGLPPIPFPSILPSYTLQKNILFHSYISFILTIYKPSPSTTFQPLKRLMSHSLLHLWQNSHTSLMHLNTPHALLTYSSFLLHIRDCSPTFYSCLMHITRVRRIISYNLLYPLAHTSFPCSLQCTCHLSSLHCYLLYLYLHAPILIHRTIP